MALATLHLRFAPHAPRPESAANQVTTRDDCAIPLSTGVPRRDEALAADSLGALVKRGYQPFRTRGASHPSRCQSRRVCPVAAYRPSPMTPGQELSSGRVFRITHYLRSPPEGAPRGAGRERQQA